MVISFFSIVIRRKPINRRWRVEWKRHIIIYLLHIKLDELSFRGCRDERENKAAKYIGIYLFPILSISFHISYSLGQREVSASPKRKRKEEGDKRQERGKEKKIHSVRRFPRS
jgi:hypothetical protein